ncbi:hypothetical protein LTR10_018271 [Elasticomyces elasticus]|uniref:Stress response protein rds1p n=1 Tax=Exophiala sideris TaxID=1016849 RepID=A0ABR0JKU0_9EURO|nr:hypothetical protein LTR10_018271 [Elasticomyces elasticus]KAK5034487.1 hypothetical protein LTS07_003408 [Exophiala sideris]KAK5042783.1 hypothetical protein LTR13_001631 [Exophiala sideris]KAK5065866.1 hypothetical protein LTR69_003416 [Exophiala sideris]KAK5185672.1 hypothetical protein LTR44_001721 [Eurotiomycetes sp. CCFEE 6388]
MFQSKQILLGLALSHLAHGAPAVSPQSSQIANPNYGPIPGESPVYSTTYTIEPPFPGNTTGAVLNTTSGPPGPNDVLWQNILGAEWIIFSFYQQGITTFNESSFTSLGLPNTTYQRFLQIRDNEAGHLRIFQDNISPTSVKPGPCKYKYPFSDAESFLALSTLIEISSMAFVTGMEYQAMDPAAAAALVAVGETETRHTTWSLIDVWNANPFSGPIDTVYPYSNQILEFTRDFIVAGSCPPENPVYPDPPQQLATFDLASNTSSIAPGSHITATFETQPTFANGKDYYAVFFHGKYNISMPFDTKTNTTTIPAAFDPTGIIIAVIADAEGAPTNTSVIAGPLIILENPANVGLSLAT